MKSTVARLTNLYAIYYADFSAAVDTLGEMQPLTTDIIVSTRYKKLKDKRYLALINLKRIGDELRAMGVDVSLDDGYDYLMDYELEEV